jgi:hypothetical protein
VTLGECRRGCGVVRGRLAILQASPLVPDPNAPRAHPRASCFIYPSIRITRDNAMLGDRLRQLLAGTQPLLWAG